jgi:flagellar assembly factor FliW
VTATLAQPLGSVTSVEFVEPILGFTDERHFTLTRLEDSGVLWALESTRTSGLRFVLAVPEPFFPDYAPVVDAHVVAPLSSDPAELAVLVILTVAGSIVTATANLFAPLILAPSTGRAMQVVLTDDTLDIRAPLRPSQAS